MYDVLIIDQEEVSDLNNFCKTKFLFNSTLLTLLTCTLKVKSHRVILVINFLYFIVNKCHGWNAKQSTWSGLSELDGVK